jgi:Tfp pilus assembly protein PilN
VSALRQQVNLYQDTAPAWRPFGSATLALAAAAVSGCLAVIWGFGSWQVDHLQQAVGALQRRQAAQQAALSALGSMPGEGSSTADLQARIQRLSGQLAARERALALLEGGALGSQRGFSAKLAALAHHSVPGLWLHGISLSEVTGSMSLAGEVISPDEVPRYLRALATEPALAGMRFDSLAIERPQSQQLPAGHARPPVRAAPTFRFRVNGTAGPVELADTEEPQR